MRIYKDWRVLWGPGLGAEPHNDEIPQGKYVALLWMPLVFFCCFYELSFKRRSQLHQTFQDFLTPARYTIHHGRVLVLSPGIWDFTYFPGNFYLNCTIFQPVTVRGHIGTVFRSHEIHVTPMRDWFMPPTGNRANYFPIMFKIRCP